MKENEEKQELILPILCPTPTKMFGHLITPLSILLAYPNTLDFFYSNYIQLCATPTYRNYRFDEDIGVINFYPKFYFYHNSVFLKIINLNETIMNIDKKDLIDNMIKWLDNGYYIQIYLNGAEIPGTALFLEKFDIINEVLFYGYNKNDKTFKFLAFDENEKLSELDMNFEDLVNNFFSKKTRDMIKESNWDSLGNEYGILLYKFKHNVKYDMNIDIIISQIEEYLYSKNSTPRFVFIDNEKTDFIFGMDIYDILIKWLSLYDCEKIDIRPLYGLWDHKTIMANRIRYLAEKGYFENGNIHIDKYSVVVSYANKIRLLLFKYNFILKNDILKNIISLLKELIEIEFNCLYDVVSDLKKNDIKKKSIGNIL